MIPVKRQKGFVDPLSLITLGVLVLGLVVSTAIVKNPNISLDTRNWAMRQTGRCPNGALAPDGDPNLCPKPPPKPPVKTKPSVPQEKEKEEEKSQATKCVKAKINTAGTCPDGKTIKYVWRNEDCSETTDTCPDESLPSNPTKPGAPDS